MAYDLVAISGPVRGTRFPLPKDQETIIGRTHRGVNLPDPQVSVRHCRVTFVKGEYQVEDLGSATGTIVNGVTIDGCVVLGLGDVMRVGESELRLDSRLAQTIRFFSWAMTPAWLMVVAAFGVLWWAGGQFPTTVSLKEPINTGVGGRTNQLTVPDAFIRAHGLDVGALALRRVTDFDADGLDELWVQVGRDELVITFDGDELVLLGRVPIGCVDRPSDQFPNLRCHGIDYQMRRGRYVGVLQTAPVVWVQGTVAGSWTVSNRDLDEPLVKDGEIDDGVRRDEDALRINATDQPVPLRVAMSNTDRLAGFLAERGVTRPAHYLICEGAVEGVPAQAVLEGGEVRRLSYGCGRDLRFEGTRSEAFSGGRILAVAFSEAGRRALTRHLTYLWSGGIDPAFLNPDRLEWITAVDTWPHEVRGGLRVLFDASEHVFNPLPTGVDLPDKVKLEIQGIERRPDAVVATLLGPGVAMLDVPGCGNVEVDVGSFRCALMRGCLTSFTFIEVRQTGCDVPATTLLRAGHAAGTTSGESNELEARVVVETRSGLGITDAIRARVMVRPKI